MTGEDEVLRQSDRRVNVPGDKHVTGVSQSAGRKGGADRTRALLQVNVGE